MTVECRICHREFKSNRGMHRHVATHDLTWENYKSGEQLAETNIEAEGKSEEVQEEKTKNIKKGIRNPKSRDLSQDTIKRISQEVFNLFQNGKNIENNMEKAPFQTQKSGIPIETIEVAGDSVKRQLMLNPDIFWRLKIFKAQNQRLIQSGKDVQPFTGGLSEFIDLATESLLQTYNMYPTVVTFAGGKMMMEMPMVQET